MKKGKLFSTSTKVAILCVTLALGFALFGCDSGFFGGGGTGSRAINGTWGRSDYDGYYQIRIDGNNWIYSEGSSRSSADEYSRGTWRSNSPITAPSSGTITLTVIQVKLFSSWQDFPTVLNDIKTNTARYSLNTSGDTVTLSNATFTTPGVWGTLEGTYRKQ